MTRETIYNNSAESETLQTKALLVFDLISRTLYSALFIKKEGKDG